MGHVLACLLIFWSYYPFPEKVLFKLGDGNSNGSNISSTGRRISSQLKNKRAACEQTKVLESGNRNWNQIIYWDNYQNLSKNTWRASISTRVQILNWKIKDADWNLYFGVSNARKVILDTKMLPANLKANISKISTPLPVQVQPTNIAGDSWDFHLETSAHIHDTGSESQTFRLYCQRR